MKEQPEGVRRWRAFKIGATVPKTFRGPIFCPVAAQNASALSPECFAQLGECRAATLHPPAEPPRATGANGQPPNPCPRPAPEKTSFLQRENKLVVSTYYLE
ncbi:unnamed protein product [Amoebophrya sp. A120]|nr:unnamed protein product [Amoebophrya sp. A120]|eukprot:GSA120T00018228001.1